jgi:hypothetical protein
MEKIAHKRRRFEHEGRTIYEWEQTLDEVSVFAPAPAGVRGAQIRCDVTATRLTLGLRGVAQAYLSEELWARAKPSESVWTLEDGVVHVVIAKAERGVAWPAVFKAHEGRDGVPAELAEQDARKELMLERFQQEHPGFDFSGAQFSGAAPDPSTFMR